MTIRSYQDAATPDVGLKAGGIPLQNATFAAVFCLIVAAGVLVRILGSSYFYLDDDAYYYELVARSLAKTGTSSFDGQTLTNGYHPLWQLLEAAVAATIGLSDTIIVVIELGLATFGVYFLMATFRGTSVLLRACFVAVLCLVAIIHVAHGMETSLFLFCFALFARTVTMPTGQRDWRGIMLTALLTIGARIDSAAFVLPMLVFTLGVRAALKPLAGAAIVGLIYAGLNQWIFGVPFPISGAVKSLGGLQIDEIYLGQISRCWQRGLSFASFYEAIRSPYQQFFAVFIGVCTATLITRQRLTRNLCFGFIIGFIAFQLKLIFGSSWAVWPWYTFPIYIGIWLIFVVIDDVAPAFAAFRVKSRTATALTAALILCIALGAVLRLNGLGKDMQPGSAEIDRLAALRFAPVLQGARVAMGDRAGTFAAFYAGPVTQLEGLVNDRAWFDALSTHADVKPILCARGVRYLLAFQKDLGAYDQASIPVMRHWLTRFREPELLVRKDDEVARFGDLAIFDNSDTDEGDDYLYAWRLRCDAG